MFKNVASQKVTVFAFDYSTGAPKTGDGANITVYVSKDDGAVTVLTDTTATEADSTNAKGCYLFDVSQTETNADKLVFTGKSSTANVSIVPQTIYTAPASFTAFVTPTGAAVNATQFAGQTITAAAGVTLPASVASPTNITAATGVVLSAAGVQAIWDALTTALTTVGSVGKRLADYITGDAYARLGAPTGASISADIAAVQADTDNIQTRIPAALDANGFIKADVEDWKGATAPAMTGDAFARLGAPAGASVSADVAAVKADTANIYAAVDTEVAAILAAVDTEVAAILALLNDARTEPGQGAPAVNANAVTKIDYLYKAFRNKVTQTATTLSIYADDATTVDHKATVSDDSVTYTRGELATGP